MIDPDRETAMDNMQMHSDMKGSIMISYQYMRMNMSGNRNGTGKLSNSRIFRPLGDYMVVPDEMAMNMHMINLMYGVTKNIRVMAMIPYLQFEMDHRTAMGNSFVTSSTGLGDLSLTLLYSIYRKNGTTGDLRLGIALPTGNINQRDETPAGPNSLLPYPMQTGTGSYSFLPGVTLSRNSSVLSWTIDLSGMVRLNENRNDYRIGDQGKLAGELKWKAASWLRPSARTSFSAWQQIAGSDPRFSEILENQVVHTVDPLLKDGSRAEVGVGLDIQVPLSRLNKIWLSLNYDRPVYQNLDGPQMNLQDILTAGIQYTF